MTSPPNSLGATVDERYAATHPGVFARLEYHGQSYEIMNGRVIQERQRRQPHNRASEILHDLIASSLVPLTQTESSSSDFASQAVEFLSCFAHRNVKWRVDVTAVPFRRARAIYGLTPKSRNEAIQYRFLRFRFPFVRFEWHVETPYHTVAALLHDSGPPFNRAATPVVVFLNYTGGPGGGGPGGGGSGGGGGPGGGGSGGGGPGGGGHFGGGPSTPIEVTFIWKAWTRNFASSAVIAFGSCTDTLVRTDQGNLVISDRSFIVTKLIQPELMIPVPYLLNVPELAEPQAFSTFSTSQSVIQQLQNSQKWLTFLVAVSALVASIKAFAPERHGVGLFLSFVAISTAAMSILVYALSLALRWVERNSAKYHVN